MQTSLAGRVRAEPNVTPMIDVMLVLLVIFMIVIPAIADGAPTVPPTATNVRAEEERPEDQTLTIDRDGHFYLNKRAVPSDSLLPALRASAAARIDDYVLYVKAHKELHFSVVRDVFSVAGDAGIRVVGLVSELPPMPSR